MKHAIPTADFGPLGKPRRAPSPLRTLWILPARLPDLYRPGEEMDLPSRSHRPDEKCSGRNVDLDERYALYRPLPVAGAA
jgi:hypothetical protein